MRAKQTPETPETLEETLDGLRDQLAAARDDRDDARDRCARLQERLEEVADLAVEHGLCHNTPYARRRFVEGE